MPLVYFLYSCGVWVFWAWVPLLLRDSGLPPARVGDLVGLHQASAALALLPIGWLSDRWSPRALCTGGAALLVLACAAVGASGLAGGGGALLVPGMVALGCGGSVFLVSINALFYKRLDVLAQGAGVGRFISGGLLGYASGPALGAACAVFGLPGAGFGAAAVFAATFLACRSLPSTEPLPVRLGEYVRDLTRPGALILLSSIAVFASHSGVEFVGLPLVAADCAGLDKLRQAVFYAVIGLWTSFLTARIGRRFDRTPRPVLLLVAGIAVSGVFQGLTGLAAGLGSLLGIRLAHTVGDSLFIVLSAILTAKVFPQARVGGLFALTQFVRQGTMAFSSGAGGHLDGAFGHVALFAASGAVQVASAGIFLGLRRRLRRAVGLSATVGEASRAAVAAEEGPRPAGAVGEGR